MTYSATMLTAVLRLLTLAAIVLMPFGMGAASASPVHHAPTSATAGHCDDQSGQPAKEPSDRTAGCVAGCSMMIAPFASAEAPVIAAAEPVAGPKTKRWSSLHPKTATPPPKLA